MELVEGETLGKWLGRPHPRAEIVRVFIAAGEGLAAAHAAGIVHRDFKPDNVLIGADGRARVTDFGLARTPASLPEPLREATLALPADDSAPTLTPHGALLGTPAYMAPEQLDGAPASASSDLFAYCTALYEALYGVRPFAGSTLLAIRQAIRAGAVREPPRAQRAPDWLHRLVLSGLQDEPAARPASMNVLLAGLRADPQRARRLAAGAALLVLLAAGAGVFAQRAASARAASCAGEAAIIESACSPGRREAMHASFRASGLAWSEPSFAAASGLLDRYARAWSEMRKDACEATRVRHEQPEETLALRAACLDDRRRELGALTELFLHADSGRSSLLRGRVRRADRSRSLRQRLRARRAHPTPARLHGPRPA